MRKLFIVRKVNIYSYLTFIVVTILLVSAYIVLETSSFDVWLQAKFFDVDAHRWTVDRDGPTLKLIFYTGPKYLLALFGLYILVTAIKNRKDRAQLKNKIVLLLGLGLIPLTCSSLKYMTKTYCQWDLSNYGGNQRYVKFLESYPSTYMQPAKNPQCFPGGHSSGGFALLALFFYWYNHPRKSLKWCGLSLGLVSGHVMGLYQMAKGAHFYSHNFATIVLTWILAWTFFKIKDLKFN